MSTNSEALRLNLDYYRKQAKVLLQSAKANEPAALARIANHLPPFDPALLKLHDAQLAVARENGFASWPRFRAFLAQSGLGDHNLSASFIEEALSDLRGAEQMLAAHPELADAGFYAALTFGDAKRIEEALRGSPDLATKPGGPRNWEPLLYLCFSRFATGTSRLAAGMASAARVLLRYGADPNSSFISKDWPDHPRLSCLYAATGLNNNPALALALLEAGANPNDGESLYHSTEHPDLACLKLLLRFGAKPAGSNALKHILDREDEQGLKLLLAAGADPNERNDRGETALHWAVWRGRSVPILAALLDSGADLDAPRKDGRTAYALAIQSGQTESATLFEARGANTEISPLDRFVGACATANPKDWDTLLSYRPEIVLSAENAKLLVDLATNRRTAAVRALLACGVPVDSPGPTGETALHWACWKGQADLVELLLAHGASLAVEDRQFHATPAGWLEHGSQNCGEGAGDYARVAQLLMAAGAKVSLPQSTID
jgi:ankyrin repeat protein